MYNWYYCCYLVAGLLAGLYAVYEGGFTTTSENITMAIEEKANTTMAIMSTCLTTSETAWQSSPSALYFLPFTVTATFSKFLLDFLHCY